MKLGENYCAVTTADHFIRLSPHGSPSKMTRDALEHSRALLNSELGVSPSLEITIEA